MTMGRGPRGDSAEVDPKIKISRDFCIVPPTAKGRQLGRGVCWLHNVDLSFALHASRRNTGRCLWMLLRNEDVSRHPDPIRLPAVVSGKSAILRGQAMPTSAK
jgi:hypothetical protein